MKSGLSVIITLTVSLILSYCSSSLYKENMWFSTKKLEECLVAALPQLSGVDYMRVNDNDVRFTMDDAEYESYVVEVYEYLTAQNFEYLGTRGEEKSTVVGAFTTWYFESADTLDECMVEESNGDYIFVYSNGEVDEDDEVIFNIISFERGEDSTYIGTKKFHYNATMAVSHESEDLLGGKYVLPEEDDKGEEALAFYGEDLSNSGA